MPTILANSIHFNYEILGARTAEPPIILIAGYACDIQFWRPVAEAFSTHTQVLIFDNQGIGKTVDDGGALSIEAMTKNTKALIDALVSTEKLANGPYIVAGFAMGGIIAQKIAADYPEKIYKLILLNSVLKFNDEAKTCCENLCIAREKRNFMEYADLIYEHVLGNTFKKTCKKEAFILDFSKAVQDVQTAADQRRQLEALKSADATTFAHQIKAPTLLIQAIPRDIFSLPEDGKVLETAIRAGGADVGVYPIISGHATILENFSKLMEGINSFLKISVRKKNV